ncbi:MAG TPA: hypothetical protein VH599_07430 [Ktedonobacterales bacterium]|jgi:hypothetical protein
MAEEERYILLEAAQKLGISKGTLVNWIARAGWSELVATQRMEYDQRAHYLTGAQLEQLAKAHRRTIRGSSKPGSSVLPIDQAGPPGPFTATNVSGIWHCRYWFPSNIRPGEEETSEYLVRIEREDDGFVLHSLPNKEQSSMVARFTIEGNIATGKWWEQTSPYGEFKGMMYRGSFELVVSKDYRQLTGGWVGPGRDGDAQKIYDGRWELTYMSETVTT